MVNSTSIFFGAVVPIFPQRGMFSKCAGNRFTLPTGQEGSKKAPKRLLLFWERRDKDISQGFGRRDTRPRGRDSVLACERKWGERERTNTKLKCLTAAFRDEEKKRPPINKQFAEMANKRWSKKLDQEEVSNLLAKYDPSESCVEISFPRVNPEIWQFLNALKRKTDLRFANIQWALQKSSFATLKNAGTLIKISDLSAPTSRVDVVALLGNATSELSVFFFFFAAGTTQTLLEAWIPCSMFFGDDVLAEAVNRERLGENDPRCQRNPSSWKQGRLL